LETIRQAFFTAASDEDLIAICGLRSGYSQVDSLSTFRAYQAAAMARRAEFAFWPHTKLEYFNNGKRQLEDCISKSRNLETVFLRYTIQSRVPGILGYNSNLDEDRRFINANIHSTSLPPKVIEQIKAVLKD
jgi:hypothetical protein